MGHILIERAYILVDSHVVVVEHNEQVVFVDRGIVQALEGETAAYRGIADNRNDVSAR